jgi:hypothetical protein
MNRIEKWNRWMAAADSTRALAPEGYDDDAALARVRALNERVSREFAEYSVKTASPALYQDSTGLSHCRIASREGDVTLCWIVLSHFGALATVKDCSDAQLLAKVTGLLEELGLEYIDYDYLANNTYQGLCQSLIGLSLANRFFALAVDWNTEA